MLVYGIRCAPSEISSLPKDTVADYYTDYGLLVFPTYTKPLAVEAHHYLTPRFWANVKRVTENQRRIIAMEFEHPYITEAESAAVKVLQDAIPSSALNWYSVPVVASRPS
jgi:hypothetical protein